MLIQVNGVPSDAVSLCETKLACGTGILPVLHAGSGLKVQKIEFIFPLQTGESIAFHNGFCTNDFALNTVLTAKPFMSRDIVMVKGDKGVFSCAMLTARRFLTRFYTCKASCILETVLEDRTYEGDVELEQFVYSFDQCGGTFFSAYCDHLKQMYHIELPRGCDAGWSSWSYYYRTVTEDDCRTQEQALRREFPQADLVQIDDGWQEGDTFSAAWHQNGQTFTHLDQPMGTSRLGLWLAPTLADDQSALFRERKSLAEARSMGGKTPQEPNDGSVYPIDLSCEEGRKFVTDAVADAQKQYHCHYFKIDFLIRSLLCQSPQNDQVVRYPGGTAVEVYQKTMHAVRERVGKDTFLLACGAPITESVGVFDGIRVSPDITWTGLSAGHPGFWALIRKNAQNVFLRSYYHGKVFLNDPDALVVRDHLAKRNDRFLPNLEEARVWATVVALSGGTVLINEDIRALEEPRLALCRQVMHPCGLAALPEDFFEYPYCSHVSLCHNGKRLAAVFNWTEESKTDRIRNTECVLAFDCWSKDFLGQFTGDIVFEDMAPHTVRTVLLVPVPEKEGFVCSCDDLFMGLTDEAITHGWYYADQKTERK